MHSRPRSLVIAALVAMVCLAANACSSGSGDSAPSESSSAADTIDANETSDTGETDTSNLANAGELEIPTPAASTVAGLFELGRPIALAHASGENVHPHSTMYGYVDAARSGVDVLDLDVQLSADGVLVVHHDSTIDRTANGTGEVANMTYEEIQSFDNAYWFTDECTCADQPESAYIFRGVRTGEVAPPEGYTPDDFSIARFIDVLERFPDHVLNIEIKGSFPGSVPAAEELAQLLGEYDRLDAAVVTSFDDQLIAAFQAAAPDVEITPGLTASAAFILGGERLPDGQRVLQLPPSYEGVELITSEVVGRIHDAGYYVWVWPNERALENAAAYSDFLDVGVDGLNAADPAAAVDAIGAMN